jgi:hypothetical protein
MLDRLRSEQSRYADYCVPESHLNNPELIEKQVQEAPEESRPALRLVLSYLYIQDGPTNLRNPQYRLAEPYLRPYEVVMGRYLKSRTNGTGRRVYGKPALHHVRKVGYKCECCGFQDVRALHLDHAHGREHSVFFLLCANCHNIKSRLFDWLGEKRVVRGTEPEVPADSSELARRDLEQERPASEGEFPAFRVLPCVKSVTLEDVKQFEDEA